MACRAHVEKKKYCNPQIFCPKKLLRPKFFYEKISWEPGTKNRIPFGDATSATNNRVWAPKGANDLYSIRPSISRQGQNNHRPASLDKVGVSKYDFH
jgi:hypothetical protein